MRTSALIRVIEGYSYNSTKQPFSRVILLWNIQPGFQGLFRALTLAAAQSVSIARDIGANISIHLQFMALAARQGVQLLVFPELSLTGYELDAAAQLAIKLDDPRLAPLRKMAQNNAMTAVIGMPVRLTGGPEILIGALVFHPDGTQSLYSKQQAASSICIQVKNL